MYAVGATHYHLFISGNSQNYEYNIPASPSQYTWNGAVLNKTYTWKVRPDGVSMGIESYQWSFTTRSTGIKKLEYTIPIDYKLSQNYPNPFNPITKIRFELPKAGNVKLTIYDGLGKEIENLANEKLQPGIYESDWDGTQYPSGVYFYRLKTDGYSETKKMILIK